MSNLPHCKLQLTPDEAAAFRFAGSRYFWSDDGMHCLDTETNELVFESLNDLFTWSEAVERDTEGGHAPFPLASPELASKLQAFLDKVLV